MKPAPNVQPAKALYLQLAGPQRHHRFQLVAFRWRDEWHIGVVTQLIRASDSPWIVQIMHGRPGDHTAFNYRDDGSIVPLDIDLSGDEPILKPQKHPRGK